MSAISRPCIAACVRGAAQVRLCKVHCMQRNLHCEADLSSHSLSKRRGRGCVTTCACTQMRTGRGESACGAASGLHLCKHAALQRADVQQCSSVQAVGLVHHNPQTCTTVLSLWQVCHCARQCQRCSNSTGSHARKRQAHKVCGAHLQMHVQVATLICCLMPS